MKDTIQSTKICQTIQSADCERMLGKAVKSAGRYCRNECRLPGRYWKMQGYFRSALLSLYRERWINFWKNRRHRNSADGILDFYFAVRDFLNISELVDENYVTSIRHSEKMEISYETVLRKSCGKSAEMSWIKESARYFFPQHLLPLKYYSRMLSTRKENFGMYVNSPFETEKQMPFDLQGCEQSVYQKRI